MRVPAIVSIVAVSAGFVQPAEAADPFKGIYIGALGAYEDYGSELIVDGTSVLSDSMSGPAGGLFAGATTINAKRSLGAGARYGYVLDGNAFLYARIGWARTKFDILYQDPDLILDVTETLDGVAFGGGVEWNLMQHLNVRVEYLRTEYEKTSDGTIDTHRNAVRVGVAAYF